MAELPNPPKYSTLGPQSLSDWVSFWRWLMSLWRVAKESINAQESITIAPRPARLSDQETLGAAIAFGTRQSRRRQQAVELAESAAFRPVGSRPPVDELGAAVLLAFGMRPPYRSPSDVTLVVSDLTLSAASTTVGAPSGGTDWVVILRQDGTGGRAVVWGAGITGASVNIDTTAGTISVFRFIYSVAATQWVMAGQPTTGMSI